MKTIIEYDLTIQDIIDFNINHHRRSKVSKERRFINKIIVSVFYFVIGIYFLLSNKSSISLIFGILFIIFASVYFFFYEKYLIRRIHRTVARLLQEGSNRGLIGRQNVILDDGTLDVINDSGKKQYMVPCFDKINEDDNNIYCYTSSIEAIIIPKKSITGILTVETFKKEINRFLIQKESVNISLEDS